jgi:tRNA(fMet)-specific endonuclease VapC
MGYLLDTNICIYIIKKSPAKVLKRLEELTTEGKDIYISSITVAELFYGVEKSSQKENNLNALKGFLSLFKIVDLPAPDGPANTLILSCNVLRSSSIPMPAFAETGIDIELLKEILLKNITYNDIYDWFERAYNSSIPDHQWYNNEILHNI